MADTLKIMHEREKLKMQKLELFVDGRRASQTWAKHLRKQCSKSKGLASGSLKSESI